MAPFGDVLLFFLLDGVSGYPAFYLLLLGAAQG